MNKNEQPDKDALQHILAAVDEVMQNTALLDNIRSEEELRQVMPALLASLGRYAQADRSYILERKADANDVLHMTHSWCANGVSPTGSAMQELPLSAVPNWFAALNTRCLPVRACSPSLSSRCCPTAW